MNGQPRFTLAQIADLIEERHRLPADELEMDAEALWQRKEGDLVLLVDALRIWQRTASMASVQRDIERILMAVAQ